MVCLLLLVVNYKVHGKISETMTVSNAERVQAPAVLGTPMLPSSRAVPSALGQTALPRMYCCQVKPLLAVSKQIF